MKLQLDITDEQADAIFLHRLQSDYESLRNPVMAIFSTDPLEEAIMLARIQEAYWAVIRHNTPHADTSSQQAGPLTKADLELALRALENCTSKNDNGELRRSAISRLQQVLSAQESQDWLDAPLQDTEPDFCDKHCVWTDHHQDCPLGRKD